VKCATKSFKTPFLATSRVLGNATKNPQNSISANQQSFGKCHKKSSKLHFCQPAEFWRCYPTKKSLKKFDFGGNSEIWRVSFGSVTKRKIFFNFFATELPKKPSNIFAF
jgi:hypothetical protein